MGDPAAARAMAAYRASQYLDQRPIALLAAVHDELCRAMASAISAHDRRALDQMCRHNARVTQLLAGLDSALIPYAARLGGLLALYARIQSATNRMLSDENATKTLRESLDCLNSMSIRLRKEISCAV